MIHHPKKTWKGSYPKEKMVDLQLMKFHYKLH
jgi:hypothetical protein